MYIRAYTLTKQKQIQAKRNSKINLYDIAHKPQRPKSLIQIPKKEGKAQETWPHKINQQSQNKFIKSTNGQRK